MNHRTVKNAVLALFLAGTVILLISCGSKNVSITPDGFLMNINDLIVEDFGIINVTSALDATRTVTEISDRLYLTMAADPVTGSLQQAELALYTDNGLEKLDYSSFEYFFLILLKAYDPNISVTNINSIHDALHIGSYDIGTEGQIGYGSNIFYYQVNNEMALFTAQYFEPTKPLE